MGYKFVYSRYTFISVGAEYTSQYVEAQLGGEMLLAALHDYRMTNVAQTIFGMALKGLYFVISSISPHN